MTQLREDDEVGDLGIARNPAGGTTLRAQAGGRLNLTFDVENGTPDDEGFYFETTLPENVWSGPSLMSPRRLPANSRQPLTMLIAPAAVPDPVEIPFEVRVRSARELAPPQCERSLTLYIIPAPGAPPPPEPELPAPAEPETAAPEPEPAAGQAPAPAPEQAAPPAAPSAKAVDPAWQVVDDGSLRQPKPPAAPGPARTGNSEATAALPVHDRQAGLPVDNAPIMVRPGERVLVRIPFVNTEPRSQNFILAEDPVRRLDTDWLALAQPEVNVSANGKGELMFLLQPPREAKPGIFDFTLHTGVRGAAHLEQRHLALRIPSTAAVKLSAKSKAARFGPFGSTAEFELSVASAGNADTAFRIAAKAPKAPRESDGRQARDDIYESETGAWSYEFDKELDNLKYLTQGRDPEPRKVRLRVRRKTPWWIGIREDHTVHVAAAPVTDLGNGGKHGNTLELSASRWRLLPIPYTLAAPLFGILLLMAFAGASGLTVTNGLPSGTANTYYVFGQPKEARLRAEFAWDGPFLVPQRLEPDTSPMEAGTVNPPGLWDRLRHRGSAELELEDTSNHKYGEMRAYRVGRAAANVWFMPARTPGALRMRATDGVRPVALAVHDAGMETHGGVTVHVKEATVTLPSGGRWLSLFLRSATPEGGSRVYIGPLRAPDVSRFEMKDFTTFYLNSGGEAPPIKIRRREGATGEGELVLATTDQNAQLLRVRLK